MNPKMGKNNLYFLRCHCIVARNKHSHLKAILEFCFSNLGTHRDGILCTFPSFLVYKIQARWVHSFSFCAMEKWFFSFL